jgi:hypothetical protein
VPVEEQPEPAGEHSFLGALAKRIGTAQP